MIGEINLMLKACTENLKHISSSKGRPGGGIYCGHCL